MIMALECGRRDSEATQHLLNRFGHNGHEAIDFSVVQGLIRMVNQSGLAKE